MRTPANGDGNYFSLFETHCLSIGCEERAEHLGYCKPHYDAEIDRRHNRLIREGKTRQTPPCFDERLWSEYEVLTLDAPNPPRQVIPCRDCTPEYRDVMRSQGRCERPEVVFVRRAGAKASGVEGITSATFGDWERACLGELGKVISMPSMADRAAAIERRYSRKGRYG